MVWNSEQSPLYRSVEQYNSRPAEHHTAIQPDTAAPAERSEQPRSGHFHNEPPVRNLGLLQKLAGDRDLLLISALIILLWREKADIKLIAALAYVLLG